MRLDTTLGAAVRELAATPALLVASDFDGTLAPLVLDPMAARPLPGAMEALTALAQLPGTSVALVSGRALAPLRALSGAAEPLRLVGSHGAELSWRDPLDLTATQRSLLAALDTELEALLAAHPGARVEVKPAARVVHTRGLPSPASQAALAAADALGTGLAGVTRTPGKEVVELAVAHVGKGAALLALAGEVGAGAVLYAGDDVTDEDAFAALAHDPDQARAARRLTVRVGDPPDGTLAGHQVEDEEALVELLTELLAARRAALG